MTAKLFTQEQLAIVQDLCKTHGLRPEQISFDETDTTPFFDHEAVSLLTLELTDIQHLDCWIAEREYKPALNTGFISTVLPEKVWRRSTAKCSVTLPDGRSRTVEDSAVLGEVLGNGVEIKDERLGDATAKSRAVRLAVRSVGVNLWNAHKQFKLTGKPATASTDVNPRQTIYNEIHAIAHEIDLIDGNDRRGYENYIEAMFPGITSSKDLNDIELHQFLVSMRGMRNVKVNMSRRPATAA